MGLSHGVTCFSQGVIISVSSSDYQGVGSRESHTAVKQSTGYFCFTQPEWTGGQHWELCPKLAPWSMGSFTQAHHPSGGLAQQHCLPSPATALGRGVLLPQLAHLGSPRRPLAVQEQSRLWEGVLWVKMSGMLPSASSFALYSAIQNHW